MRRWVRTPLGAAGAAVLLAGAVGLAGCGSSSDGTTASRTQLVGTVEAPAAQVARAGGLNAAAIARLLAIGSRAEAAGPIARVRVTGAAVTVERADDGRPVGVAVTGPDGTFRLDLTDIPAGSLCVVTAKAQGAHGGQIRLRAVVRVGAGSQTSATVNEATTVGADAADEVAADGADADTAKATADEVTDEQEKEEAQDPAAVPDVSDTDGAKAQVRQQARKHLTAALGKKLPAVVGNETAPQARQIRQAIMAAQAYARVALGFSPALRLSPAQVAALATLIADGKTFTALEVAGALKAADIAAGDDIEVEQTVKDALGYLKERDGLTAILQGVADDGIPALVALLLAEQANDARVAFRIETQEQLNAYVGALAGATVAGPGALPLGLGHGGHGPGGPR